MSYTNDNDRVRKWKNRKEVYEKAGDDWGLAVIMIVLILFGGVALYAGYFVATTLWAIPNGRVVYEAMLLTPTIAVTIIVPVLIIAIPSWILYKLPFVICDWMIANANEGGDD